MGLNLNILQLFFLVYGAKVITELLFTLITFVRIHAIGQYVRLNDSPFSSAVKLTLFLTIWVVELIEMHGNVPVLDMWHAFRHHESWVVFRDFRWNSLNF